MEIGEKKKRDSIKANLSCYQVDAKVISQGMENNLVNDLQFQSKRSEIRL